MGIKIKKGKRFSSDDSSIEGNDHFGNKIVD